MGEDGNAGKEELAQGRQPRGGQSATPTLDAYSRDLTVLAKEGKLALIDNTFLIKASVIVNCDCRLSSVVW